MMIDQFVRHDRHQEDLRHSDIFRAVERISRRFDFACPGRRAVMFGAWVQTRYMCSYPMLDDLVKTVRIVAEILA